MGTNPAASSARPFLHSAMIYRSSLRALPTQSGDVSQYTFCPPSIRNAKQQLASNCALTNSSACHYAQSTPSTRSMSLKGTTGELSLSQRISALRTTAVPEPPSATVTSNLSPSIASGAMCYPGLLIY